MVIRVIGQKNARKLIRIMAPRRAPLLFVGPPGRGKSHLAKAYMVASGCSFRVMEGSRVDCWLATWWLGNPSHGLVIDEVHKLRDPESFYELLDRRQTTDGAWLNPIAATTTDEGMLPGPLLSRFFLVHIEPYTEHELAEIAKDAADIQSDVAHEVARLSRGSPRRAVYLAALLSACRVEKPEEVDSALQLLNMRGGLTGRERNLLAALAGGPKSLDLLCRLLSTGRETVRMVEAELIAAGLVQITSRGRMLTKRGEQLVKKLVG